MLEAMTSIDVGRVWGQTKCPARTPWRTYMHATLLAPTVVTLCAGLAASTASAQCDSISQTNGPAGALVSAATIEGSTAYLWSGAGLAKSTNSGQSWSPVPATRLTCSVITALRLAGPNLLAATNTGPARSLDGGLTWEPFATHFTSSEEIINFERFGTTGVFALGRIGSVSYSLDNGLTWNALNLPDQFFNLVSDGTRIHATFWTGVVSSDDFGATWYEDTTPPEDFIFGRSVVSAGSATLAVAGWAQNKIFRSTDAGRDWQPVPSAPVGVNKLINADDGSILALGAGGVYRTTDQGLNWTLISTSLPSSTFVSSSDPLFQASNGVIIQASGNTLGLIRSTDSGATWSNDILGIIGTTISSLVWDGSSTVAFDVQWDGISSQFRASSDRGQTWRPIWEDITGYNPVSSLNEPGNLLLGTGGSGLFRSTNSGQSWLQVVQGIPDYNSAAGGRYRTLSAITRAGSSLVMGTGVDWENVPPTPPSHSIATRAGGAGFLRSTNNGASWSPMNNGYPVDWVNEFGQPRHNPVTALITSGSRVLAATQSRGIYAASTTGASWSASSAGLPTCGGANPATTSLAKVGSSVFVGLAGFGASCPGTGRGVYRSVNEGLNWTNASNGLPNAAVSALESHAGRLYAIVEVPGATSRAIYRSTDLGSTWTIIDNSESVVFVSMRSTPQGLFVASAGRGVWIIDPCVPCPADFDNSGGTPDASDIDAFFNAWLTGLSSADIDASGGTPDAADVNAFFIAWLAGSC
jgi:hypothetical protein